jgi:hypothetical protein
MDWVLHTGLRITGSARSASASPPELPGPHAREGGRGGEGPAGIASLALEEAHAPLGRAVQALPQVEPPVQRRVEIGGACAGGEPGAESHWDG